VGAGGVGRRLDDGAVAPGSAAALRAVIAAAAEAEAAGEGGEGESAALAALLVRDAVT
jgi:hypothetical protein